MMSEYDVTCGHVSHLTPLSSFSIEYYPNSSALHSSMGGDLWEGLQFPEESSGKVVIEVRERVCS